MTGEIELCPWTCPTLQWRKGAGPSKKVHHVGHCCLLPKSILLARTPLVGEDSFGRRILEYSQGLVVVHSLFSRVDVNKRIETTSRLSLAMQLRGHWAAIASDASPIKAMTTYSRPIAGFERLSLSFSGNESALTRQICS